MNRNPRRLLVEWLVLALALAVLAATAHRQQWTWRIDLAIHDAGIGIAQRPASEDIVIVAIDDRSLARIGRWPWPRTVQAALLDRVADGRPRAVAVDLIFAEPDADPQADAALAAAFARLPPHALATAAIEASGPRRFLAPLPGLSGARTRLGHVHVEIDPDAVVRSVYLLEGPTAPDLPHLSLALLAAAGERHGGTIPGAARPPGLASGALWQRDHWYRIPFSGPPGHVQRVSAGDLIAGAIRPGSLRDRLVLVGATAAGLGDGYAVPTSGAATQLMPGVELHAQVLDGLRRAIDVRDVGRTQGALLAAVLVLGTLAAYLRLSPRNCLLLTATVAAGTLVAALLGPRLAQTWFAPASTVLALALAYPLWSWRRLEASLAYMRTALIEMDAERKALPALPGAPAAPRGLLRDPVEQAISAVQDATDRARDLGRFLRDSLDRQTDGVLVTDLDGRIVLCNARAAELTGRPAESLGGVLLEAALPDIAAAAGIGARLGALQPGAPGPAAQVEVHGAGGLELLVGTAECRGTGGGLIGHVVNLTDVSRLKAAASAREEAMRFLSHDLRAPQASILTAIELRRMAPEALSEAALLEQAERSVRRTLELADAFLTLTRADHLDASRFVPVELADVVREMSDEAWSMAGDKGIELACETGAPESWVLGDRTLLCTAVRNLIVNAIQYAPGGSRVSALIRERGAEQVVTIEDAGPGIAAADIPSLFERYRRLASAARERREGTGLGLVIVDTIARNHGGRVEVRSAPGRGSAFSIVLPRLAGDTPMP